MGKETHMEVKRVFISYSNVDREIAEKIADILKMKV